MEPAGESCLSEHSSDEESDMEASEQPQSSEDGHAPLPYPYVGRPYVTNSLLNTIDLQLLRNCAKEVKRYKAKCVQLESSNPMYSLNHVLFEGEAVSFSRISG